MTSKKDLYLEAFRKEIAVNKKLQQQEVELRQLREALEFYANQKAYKAKRHGFVIYKSEVLMDNGAKARAALGRPDKPKVPYSTGPR